MFDKLFLVFLGIFLFLYGIAAVTNLRIEWMVPLTGMAALVAGVIAVIRAFR